MNLNNIFVEPQVTIQSLNEGRNKGKTTILVNVTGLVCENMCENRVLIALNTITSVGSIIHKRGSGDFLVQISGSEVKYEQIKSSILSQVIALPLRRLLGRLGNLLIVD